MELHLGKTTNSELAEWFGLKSFAKHKKEKLEELKEYAEFYEDKGKVVITKILSPVYIKNKDKDMITKEIKDTFDNTWNENGLDTCARVAEVMYHNLEEKMEVVPYAPSSIYAFTRNSRNELYGKPWQEPGERGSCYYTLCKVDENGCYQHFTEEEKEIKNKLQTKYFGDATEKQVLVNAMYLAGEVSKEEAYDLLMEWTNMGDKQHYMRFLEELKKELGVMGVKKVTYIERGAFELESKGKE